MSLAGGLGGWPIPSQSRFSTGLPHPSRVLCGRVGLNQDERLCRSSPPPGRPLRLDFHHPRDSGARQFHPTITIEGNEMQATLVLVTLRFRPPEASVLPPCRSKGRSDKGGATPILGIAERLGQPPTSFVIGHAGANLGQPPGLYLCGRLQADGCNGSTRLSASRCFQDRCRPHQRNIANMTAARRSWICIEPRFSKRF